MNTSKIITVTLNPSLDRTLVTHFLAIGYHNHTTETTRLDPAGVGLTISRALSRLRCETQAIIMVGNDATGRAYQALLSEENFPKTVIMVEGQTRSNTVIMDTGTKNETQITEDCSEMSEHEFQQVVQALKKSIKAGDYVVFAGPLPKGSSPEAYARLTHAAHLAGGKVALIDIGNAIEPTLAEAPDLLALTQQELEGFFNYPVRVIEDVIDCAEKLREKGALQVFVEMPEKGNALLVGQTDSWVVSLPELVETEGTSSGIWEAMIAGFLAGRARRQPREQALELGAAAAGYTASQVGHKFGTLKEVNEFTDQVEVTSIDETAPNP